jgi:ribosomal protein L7/L12
VNKATALLAEKLAAGLSFEHALAILCEEGATPVEAIKAICEVKAVGLAEAKVLFSQSPAWRKEVEAADRLHEELFAVFNMKEQS